VVFCLVAAVSVLGLPPIANVITIQDSPGLAPKPGAPQPDSDGVSVEEIVNVKKKAIIVIVSGSTPDAAARRALVRETWMQALNRSSNLTLNSDDRRSVATWFMISSDPSNPAAMAAIEAEGKLTGDILLVDSVSANVKPDDLDVVGAVLRWLRVAYYQRYDLALITPDDTFVSLSNLLDFCTANENSTYFYGGYLNRYEIAAKSYGHKYYPPFVQMGTFLIGSDTAELISHRLPLLKHLPRWDATIGLYLSTYDVVTPISDPRFVPSLEKVYDPIFNVILVNHVTADQMRFLSRPHCVAGKCSTPMIPAITREFRSTYVYVDPYPTDHAPECDGVDGVKCALDALKAMETMMQQNTRHHN